MVINKVSEIGDDTTDDGSSTQNSVQNATNSSKSSADGISCILRKFINYCQGLLISLFCVSIDQRMDLNPTPGPSALSGPKANQSKKKSNDFNDLDNYGNYGSSSDDQLFILFF